MDRTGDGRRLPQSDYDAFDRVLAEWACRVGFGTFTATATDGRVKDSRSEGRAHLGSGEKPSDALKRLLPG